MPNEQQHLQKADSNEAFAASLDLTKPPNCEWALTAIFYSAVHRVEAHFAKSLNYHSNTHEERKKAMAKDRVTKNCFLEYSHLETLSKNCRYGVARYTEKSFKDAIPRLYDLKKKLK